MRYVESRIDQNYRDETYRIYVTQCLQMIPQNKYPKISYIEFLNRKSNEPVKTGDEIVLDIFNRGGLSFG